MVMMKDYPNEDEVRKANRKPYDTFLQAFIRDVLTPIYSIWHGCAIVKSERNLPRGRLCESCESDIEMRIDQAIQDQTQKR